MKPRDIKRIVEKISGIEDLSTKNRERYIADCRFVYMELCKKFCFCSLSQIAKPINRTHATVLNGLKGFKYNYNTDWFTANKVYIECLKRVVWENRQNTPPELKEVDPKNYYKILYIRHQEKTRATINKLRYKLQKTRQELNELQNK